MHWDHTLDFKDGTSDDRKFRDDEEAVEYGDFIREHGRQGPDRLVKITNNQTKAIVWTTD